MIYFVMIIISILFGACASKKRSILLVDDRIGRQTLSQRSVFIVFSALPVFLISALRYGIGTDYFFTYDPWFKLVLRGGVPDCEVGFYYLNKIIAYLTDNSQWLFAITSLLFIGCVYWAIYKKDENIPISILIFFLSYNFFVSLNNLRQSLASAITLVAMCCLIDGRKKAFAVLTIIAGSIHQSTFIILIYYVIFIADFPAYMYLIIGLLNFPFAYRIAPLVLNFMSRLFPRLTLYSTAAVFSIFRGRTITRLYILINLALMGLIAVVEGYFGRDNRNKIDIEFAATK